MKIFVSGSTGYIGSRLAQRLASDGHQVHALYRDISRTASIQHANIKLFKGDILDFNSLEKAIEGCSQIYHTAAFAKVWDKDISNIYRLNIEGAMNVARAGKQSGVKRMVFTSTAGVLGPSISNHPVDENTHRPKRYFIDYESSKSIMEQALFTLSAAGIEIVIVNPTRVYGPGLFSESNGVTKMIQGYLKGKWRIIPGNGKSIGNYVYIDDVVNGHILGMEKGKPGERYVLGGENLSYDQFFNELAKITGKKLFMFHIPLKIMHIITNTICFLARISGRAPMITPSLVKKFNHQWEVSSQKAESELCYIPRNFRTGATETIKWLKSGL